MGGPVGYKPFVKRTSLLVLLLVLVWALVGCGGSGGNPTTGLRVTPANTGALVDSFVQLSAVPVGGVEQVEWSVEGGSANGTVTTDGRYRTPSTPGTYRVRVQVKGKPDIFAVSTIDVASSVSVSIAPTAVKPRWTFGETIKFLPNVQGQGTSEVAWSASGGLITDQGVFTAPRTSGMFTINCKSLRDGTKVGSYKVLVSDQPVVKIKVEDKGEIFVRMARNEAPKTTQNFMSLALSGFYDGTFFHRYGPDESLPQFIQGGDPQTKTLPLTDPRIGTGHPGFSINFEANPLKHTAGAIAMARASDPNSAGCQFYICGVAIPDFDSNYVVFGNVIEGLPIVQQLRKGDRLESATLLD